MTLYLIHGFESLITKQENNCINLRVKLTTKEEAQKWKENYCKNNNVTLNVGRAYTRKAYFRRRYICLHGDQRHLGIRKKFTGCKFEIDLCIKSVSSYTATKDPLKAQYPCFIVIKGTHNHSLESAMGLQQLRVLPDTEKQFFKYFEMGLTSSQATRLHQEKLSLNITDIANHGLNPSPRSAEYLREVWLKEKNGQLSGETMFTAIKNYAHEHAATTKIQVEEYGEEEFAIVLVTNLMMRCHQEFQASSEVVLVYTTSHVDQSNTAVTPLLCAGPVGGIPLGIMFTSSQNEISYRRGFQLLKKVFGDSAFYGKGHPECFITDNSYPEGKALKAVWPESQLLERKEEWSNHCRAGRLLHGQQTNNFAESAMHVIKDVVFNRSKAYNTCQLVMLMNEVYDSYVKHHFLDVPLGHKKIKTQKANSSVKDIVQISEFLFEVKSVTKGDKYSVDMEIGICDCVVGQTGAICEHQQACAEKYVLELPQEKTTAATHQWLDGIALGRSSSVDSSADLQEGTAQEADRSVKTEESCADRAVKIEESWADRAVKTEESWADRAVKTEESWADRAVKTEEGGNFALAGEEMASSAWATTADNEFSALEKSDTHFVHEPMCVIDTSDDYFVELPETSATQEPLASSTIREFTCFMEQLLTDYGDGNTTLALKSAMHLGRKYCKTGNFLNSALSGMFSQGISKTGGGGGRGKIPCKPTSIARRIPGVSRGAAPAGKGRKRKGSLLEKAAK